MSIWLKIKSSKFQQHHKEVQLIELIHELLVTRSEMQQNSGRKERNMQEENNGQHI